MQVPLIRQSLAELIGTAFLLTTVIGSGIMAERLAGGNIALALLCNTVPTTASSSDESDTAGRATITG